MPPAFVAPALFHHPRRLRRHVRWACSTKPNAPCPPGSADEPDSGSASSSPSERASDQQYLNKVRAKLFNMRRAVDAARALKDGAVPNTDAADDDADTLFTASLPDNLDQIEDILYDRGPKNINQVRLFGGWLDDSVAGRKASDPDVVASESRRGGQFDVESFHKISLSKQEALDRANEAFASAMAAFNKGQYKQAVVLYDEAVQYVGVQSRLGGQYQLWHAQALDATGQKEEAAALLEGLRTHGDLDVRKVSRELLFIITAPRLEVEPGTFLNIPVMEEESRSRIETVLTSSYGPLRTALMEKTPERYSLQWYLQKERPPKLVDHSRMDLVLVAVAICFTLAFMLISRPS